MAFTTAINTATKGTEIFGAKKVIWGTYTNTGGSTGGEVDTTLSRVDFFSMQPKGTVISANQPVINETLPLSSNNVTIVTSADELGVWFAIGV